MCLMKYAHVLHANIDEPTANDLPLHNHVLDEIYSSFTWRMEKEDISNKKKMEEKQEERWISNLKIKLDAHKICSQEKCWK